MKIGRAQDVSATHIVGDAGRRRDCATLADHAPAIPTYLEQVYWWAYIHPAAVRLFERQWLLELILFGNYGRLRDATLAELGATVTGRTLQVACAYGDLTPRLHERLGARASLDVVDVLPIQLRNLASKLPADPRVTLVQSDACALPFADDHYDQVLLFFLLHEQPRHVRRATLSEAMRVVKPGGKVVIVDYHRPVRLHPLRPLLAGIFRKFEPYALDMWEHEIVDFLVADPKLSSLQKNTWFGGLYQKLVLTR